MSTKVKEEQDINVVDAIAGFNVVNKPEEAVFFKRSMYAKYALALKYLSNDKAIELTKEHLLGKPFQQFRWGLSQACKKLGIKLGACEKNGSYFIFTR